MTGATVVPTTGKGGRGRRGRGGIGGIFSGVVFCRGLGFAVVTDNGGGSLKRSKENISDHSSFMYGRQEKVSQSMPR